MSQPRAGRPRAQSRTRPNRSTTRTPSSGSAGGSYDPRGHSPRSGGGRSAAPRSQAPRARAPRQDPAGAELDAALTVALGREYPAVESFEQLGVPAVLVDALRLQGVTAPFAIQTRALPDALAGRDLLGRAQTGSGKTLAFGLPLVARLAADGATRTPGAPRGLVLVPTRELALQVTEVLVPLAAALKLRVCTVYGGAPYGRQLDALARGVDIVVATPGRLVDLIERRACRLDEVALTVLDEADYMADLGFLPVVTRLLEQTRPGGQRLLFSATLDRGVAGLVRTFLTDPALHAVAPSAAPVESMDHQVFRLDNDHKLQVAAEVAGRPGRTLFFVRTKHGADRLVTQLGRHGVDAVAIHGDRGQGARQRALADFADGRTRVLVATDVAARGIHVDGVDLVVHFDPPNDAKDYLHRSGRTARAGNAGTVLSLARPEELGVLRRLHADARVVSTVTNVHPGHGAVRELATSGEPVVVQPRREQESRGGEDRQRRYGRRPQRRAR
jgi:superfamily II DNA/RNA helicase